MKVDFIFNEGSSKEDLYLTRDNLFAVFDGFDSLKRFTDKDGKSGGLIAAEIAKDEFSKNNADFEILVTRINQKIKERMLALNIDVRDKSRVWGVVLAGIKVKQNLFEWVQIGDCIILVIYKDDSFKLLVKDYDHDKEVLKMWKELANQRQENIKELIDKDALPKLRNEMNRTYGCLTGEEGAISFLKSGVEELENIKYILLFTDGLIIPKKDPLKEDDWDMLVKLFLEGGLENIKNFVRDLEKDDPKCWKYPRYKQYDDIAAISLSF